MRTALGFAALLLPVTLAVACGSSSTANDAGPLGEGGCLEETPTQGAPCNAGQMLCNPGDLCCGGEWTCDTSTHTWTLLQGRCACFPDSGVPDVSVPSDSGGCPASCPPGQILVDWNTSSPGFPGTSGCACKPNPCPDGGVGCTCSQACQQTISNGTSCCNWTGPILYCNGCG